MVDPGISRGLDPDQDQLHPDLQPYLEICQRAVHLRGVLNPVVLVPEPAPDVQNLVGHPVQRVILVNPAVMTLLRRIENTVVGP